MHLRNSAFPGHEARSVIAHFDIGRILIATHELPEAVKELTQALRFDPSNADAHNDLGAAMFQLGDYGKAAEQFSDAVRIDPADANARKISILLKPN